MTPSEALMCLVAQLNVIQQDEQDMADKVNGVERTYHLTRANAVLHTMKRAVEMANALEE